MLRKVVVLLAALPLLLLLPRLALGQSLADTKWTVDGSSGTNGGLETLTFKSDSTVRVADDWDDQEGTWKQEGNTITIEYGPETMGRKTVVVRIEATRNGEKMTGTRTRVSSGDKKSWSAAHLTSGAMGERALDGDRYSRFGATVRHPA